jgi:hypothetical protein
MNQRFGETFYLHIQGRKSAKKETSVQQVARQNSSGFLLVGSYMDYTALCPRR